MWRLVLTYLQKKRRASSASLNMDQEDQQENMVNEDQLSQDNKMGQNDLIDQESTMDKEDKTNQEINEDKKMNQLQTRSPSDAEEGKIMP